jgi:transcriptional regulator with XRE-family HTH domain
MTDQQAMRRIAKNLRRFREAAGLSMSALARDIGDYPNAIERIEKARNMPGVGLMTRIAERLDKTLDDFLEEEPAKILSRTA